jgi:uncharacterized protein (TIGR03083 family)
MMRTVARVADVPPDEVFALIRRERHRAADMFEALTDEQWQARSLCTEWSVREVAAHLTSPFCISAARFAWRGMLAGGFHRYSIRLTKELAQRPTGDLVAILRANADRRFAPPATGPLAPLTDLAVHTRDVARPLGLDTCASLHAWRGVLDFLVSSRAKFGFVPRRRLDGLALRASDQDWSAGAGADLFGPSEALALAVAGRAVALDDLTGAGVSVLRARLT